MPYRPAYGAGDPDASTGQEEQQAYAPEVNTSYHRGGPLGGSSSTPSYQNPIPNNYASRSPFGFPSKGKNARKIKITSNVGRNNDITATETTTNTPNFPSFLEEQPR